MWKEGPLPPDTWGWGGVMPFYLDSGFFFADFRGDHVTTATRKVFHPNEVKLCCN